MTMKTIVVMPPPGTFQGVDLYWKERWRRAQHITNEFWSRWRKEFLTSLQTWMKWNETRRNFKVGHPEKNGTVWSVMLKLGNTKSRETLRRPISRLVLLIADNENWISKEVWFPDEGAFGCWEC